MGKTTESIMQFSNNQRQRKLLNSQIENQNFDRQLKLGELQSKGVNITEESSPRKLFGFIPAGTQRSLSMSYDPTMNPDYEKKSLQNEKLKREIASYDQPLPGASGGESSESGSLGNDPLIRLPGGKVIANPSYAKPLNELQQAQLADRKRKEAEASQAKQEQVDQVRKSAEENLSTIGEVKKGLNYFGPYGDIPSWQAPETMLGLNKEEFGKRKNWESNVDKILSQKTLDKLAELKALSKTGASGLGSVTEKEMKILENAATALKRTLNPEDAQRYVNDIEEIYKKVLNRI